MSVHRLHGDRPVEMTAGDLTARHLGRRITVRPVPDCAMSRMALTGSGPNVPGEVRVELAGVVPNKLDALTRPSFRMHVDTPVVLHPEPLDLAA